MALKTAIQLTCARIKSNFRILEQWFFFWMDFFFWMEYYTKDLLLLRVIVKHKAHITSLHYNYVLQ